MLECNGISDIFLPICFFLRIFANQNRLQMKRVFLFLLPFLLMGTALAYDFSAVSPSGQTLYYNIIAGTTNVKVTHPGTNGAQFPYPSGYSKPTGYLVIPSSVTNNGTTYTVTEIKGYTFNTCLGLTSVLIPASVTIIRSLAFYNCTGLDTLYVLNSTPPELGFSQSQGPFEGVPSDVVIAVPVGSLSAYQNATGWSGFSNIVEIGSTPVPVPQPTTHTITATANNTSLGSVIGAGTYPHGATVQLAAVGKRNCTFNQWNDGDTNNPRQLTLNANVSLVANFSRTNVQIIHDTVVRVYHDTVLQHDTLVFHDTVVYTLYVHDTIQQTDTLTVWDTVIAYVVNYIHDTVSDTIVQYIHDTTVAYVTTYIHDTVTIHSDDTAIVYVPTYIHDTVIAFVTNYIHDTVYLAQHDTLFAYITQYIHDTVVIQEHDTLIAVITQYVHDTSTIVIDNYIFDTIFVTDTLYITDTLYLYDTVYIHDTVYITQEGIEPTDANTVKLYASAGRIVIEGAESLPVRMYDMSGRMLYSGHSTTDTPLTVPMPSSGAYLVKIGDLAPRKIVVVR